MPAPDGLTLGARPSRVPLSPRPYRSKPAPDRRPKTLYLREDQILERVRAALGDRPDLGDRPQAIAHYLRANNLTVVCTAQTVTIDTPTQHAEAQALIVRAEMAPATL